MPKKKPSDGYYKMTIALKKKLEKPILERIKRLSGEPAAFQGKSSLTLFWSFQSADKDSTERAWSGLVRAFEQCCAETPIHDFIHRRPSFETVINDDHIERPLRPIIVNAWKDSAERFKGQ